MSSRDTKWIYDSRGQKIPLRSDPEKIWRHQQSFRLNITAGDRLIKKHPRIAIVLAMREIPDLSFRPDTRKGRVWIGVYYAGYALVVSAILYGFLLRDFFGTRNWSAMLITFMIILGFCFCSAWFGWRKADRRMARIQDLLKDNPFYCAGCWYPLDPLFEPDGCVICPECGAAWVLEKMHAEKQASLPEAEH